MPPKRKAPARISGLVDSDDDDIMQFAGAETQQDQQQQQQKVRDEPPNKKQRGRPRSSNEAAAEPKTTTRSKKQESATAVEEEAPKKVSRRGRPRGSSDPAGPSGASAAKGPADAQEEIQADAQEHSANVGDVKATRTTRTTRPTATRGRGRGRTAGAARPSVTDGDFEYTPTRAQQSHREAEIPDTQADDAHMANPEVEESVLPDPQSMTNYSQSSITKTARARLAAVGSSLDASPRKRKSGVTSEQGDPELRRRIGDLTKKNDTLESKLRDLREIGVEEAKTNMEKLRKQCDTITTGMFTL